METAVSVSHPASTQPRSATPRRSRLLILIADVVEPVLDAALVPTELDEAEEFLLGGLPLLVQVEDRAAEVVRLAEVRVQAGGLRVLGLELEDLVQVRDRALPLLETEVDPGKNVIAARVAAGLHESV